MREVEEWEDVLGGIGRHGGCSVFLFVRDRFRFCLSAVVFLESERVSSDCREVGKRWEGKGNNSMKLLGLYVDSIPDSYDTYDTEINNILFFHRQSILQK